MLRDYQFLAHRIGLLHRKEPASPMAVVGSWAEGKRDPSVSLSSSRLALKNGPAPALRPTLSSVPRTVLPFPIRTALEASLRREKAGMGQYLVLPRAFPETRKPTVSTRRRFVAERNSLTYILHIEPHAALSILPPTGSPHHRIRL
jgi:hypothetical protein